MKLAALARLDRSARRLREIVGVLGRYGLADWIASVDVAWLKSLLGATRRELIEIPREQRIRRALAELGTTFIKLGQMLSTRPDVVGTALAEELGRLREGAPADDPAVVIATLERELGRPLGELFASFQAEPLASASIAQVHGVVLHDGSSAVVKVMRAGVEDQVATDLDLLAALAEFAEEHSAGLRLYRPVAIAVEFRRTILGELDFTRERSNLDRFARTFADDPTVRFPAAVRELSSRRVLTMERLDGIRVSDREALQTAPIALGEFARRGAEMYLRMIFRDGFYHADPHAGNVLILRDGAVGVLDCGMVGHIDDLLREDFEAALFAVLQGDSRELADVVARLGAVPADVDHDGLRRDLAALAADHFSRGAGETDVTAAIEGLLDCVHRYHVFLPAPFALLLRVLVMLEGLARGLEPRFQLADLLGAYARSAVARRASLRETLRRLRRTHRDWRRLLEAMPRDAGEILRGLRQGRFELHLEHRRLETTVNRLVQGIVSAALFLGCALMLSQRVPPQIGDVSVPGALGAALAVLLFARLWLSIRGSRSDPR
ncbi:MAG: AarF/ABC1/UbiB kinase family protein [Planctomycetes bacterium]|nr:AarF/ABC1/UbiB kinase family protein [Planctomycetota bacterium]